MIRRDSHLLIVQGDAEVSSILSDAVCKVDNLLMIGITESEEEALNILNKQVVDILLVDLELGEGTGLHLIEKLRMIQSVPVIIVMTDSKSKVIRNILNEQEVDFIYHKTDIEYDCVQITYLLRKIIQCHSTDVNDEAEQQNGDLKKEIQKKLDIFGFPAKCSGTSYLIEAVRLAALQNGKTCNLKNDIYARVARIYETTVPRVESSIRFVIEQVWLKQNLDWLKRQYPFEYDYTTGKPTNKSFILNLAGMFIGRK